jgi:hypothetical protein
MITATCLGTAPELLGVGRGVFFAGLGREA